MEHQGGGGHGFQWLSLIHGFNPEFNHVYMAIMVAGLLLVALLIARLQLNRALKAPGEGLVPESKLTYRNFFEIVAEQLFSVTEGTLGREAAHTYFPVIGALFLFIFVSNVLGLIPGFLPSTDNMNTTFGLGLFVFVYYNYKGLRENGLNYLKHFLGPMLVLSPLMLLIELISHGIRPLSLGMRLRANIMGDHAVLGVFSDLVPLGVPIIFYGMGLFVAFIQSFVFCLMTMVYISLAVAHEEDH